MRVAVGSAQAELDAARSLHARGRLAEARRGYEALLSRDPANADALHLLGVLALQSGNIDAALEMMNRALAGRPDFPEALNNRGNALKAAGRVDEAVASYRAAIAARPGYLAAHVGLGVLLWEQNRPEEAEQSYREALAIDPRSAVALTNLGAALRDQQRFEEAAAVFRGALAIDQRQAEAHGGLGDALGALGETDAALAAYDRALELSPSHLDTHLNRGTLLLSLGRFAEGWPEYEHRRRQARISAHTVPGPEWRGEPLAGRTLLCYAEQGLGDTLQFVRFAAVLSGKAGRVVVEAQPALVPLLRTVQGIGVIGRGDARPTYDFVVPLMSLPHLMRIDIEDLPGLGRYIGAEPKRAARWKARLPDAPLCVGIAWQGNPDAKIDRGRSLPLAAFGPLLEVADVALVSLQKGAGSEQLDTRPEGRRIARLGPDFDAGPGAFLDTVAVMQGLDLVVTSDSAIAHVAGALGVETWVLLQAVPDWRWMRERTDSPWYPRMRLFRQRSAGDWGPVMDEVAAALGARIEGAGA